MKPPNNEGPTIHMDASSGIQKITDLPLELRNLILQNCSEPDLANYAMVNRQCCIDCAEPSLPQTRTAIIRCQDRDDDDENINQTRINHHPLIPVLVRIQVAKSHFRDRFRHIKLVHHQGLPKLNMRDAKPVIKHLSLPLVTYLDMSFSTKRNEQDNNNNNLIPPSVAKVWTQILPSLVEINLNGSHLTNTTLSDFSRNCPHLTKITCQSAILEASVTGLDLDQCQHLKELYLDHTQWAATATEAHKIFEDHINNNNNNNPPLSKCLQHLERVSLKGAQFFDAPKGPDINNSSQPFTQVSLIKFVRSAKKLKWFKSDLTLENIAMLLQERPEISFVSN